MRLKALTVCFSVSALLASQQSAIAATKAGATCTKLNATATSGSTILKCTKTGKKLIWKVVPPTPATRPTPSPTPTTPATKLGQPCARYMEIDSANNFICQYESWKLVWLNRAKALTPAASSAYKSISSSERRPSSEATALLTFYQSPNFSEEKASRIKSSLLEAISFWAKDYLPRNKLPVLFYTELDRAWYKSTLESIGLDSELVDFGLAAFDTAIAQSGSGVSTAGAGIGTRTKSFRLNTYLFGTKATEGVGFTAVAAHEWTHNAQNSLGIGSEMPCWFREGQAFYYGAALSSKNLEDFAELRREAFWSNADISIKKTPAEGWSAWLDKRLLTNYPSNCGPDGVYVVGGLLTEYMVSLKGHQGIVDFLKAMKSEPWDKALVTVYGLSWEDLKKQFIAYLSDEVSAFDR